MASAQEIHRMLTVDYMTLGEVANVFGISRQRVHQILKAQGLVPDKYPPYNGRHNVEVQTPQQFKAFLEGTKNIKEAAEQLKIGFHTLKKWMKFLDVKHKWCYMGKNAPHYKEGKTKDKNGYVWVNAWESGYAKFNSKWKSHQVMQHKQVMEMQVLGVVHPKGYVVHHIDGNRENNKIENLALLTAEQHMLLHRCKDRGGDVEGMAEDMHKCNVKIVVMMSVLKKCLKKKWLLASTSTTRSTARSTTCTSS